MFPRYCVRQVRRQRVEKTLYHFHGSHLLTNTKAATTFVPHSPAKVTRCLTSVVTALRSCSNGESLELWIDQITSSRGDDGSITHPAR